MLNESEQKTTLRKLLITLPLAHSLPGRFRGEPEFDKFINVFFEAQIAFNQINILLHSATVCLC